MSKDVQELSQSLEQAKIVHDESDKPTAETQVTEQP